MDFELTDEQRKWRDEVKAFLTKNVTAELLHELTHLGAEARGPELREFRRRVGENGWYGLTWPEEFGGLGRGPIDQHILVTEFLYAGVPGPDFTVTSMVPMILQWGTEQNKREFLPGIASGEIFAAIGYSEPGAGTDLASLRTRAELVGDDLRQREVHAAYALPQIPHPLHRLVVGEHGSAARGVPDDLFTDDLLADRVVPLIPQLVVVALDDSSRIGRVSTECPHQRLALRCNHDHIFTCLRAS